MLDAKTVVKEFIEYSIGIMFLWLLSIAFRVKRDVQDGPKHSKGRNPHSLSRRSSKVEYKKLPSQFRNMAKQENDNKTSMIKLKNTRRKKPHAMEISYGCWAVLLLPVLLALLSAVLPLEKYFPLFDEVWMRNKAHKLKIVFHEIVYREPLSHYDWTSTNIISKQKAPIDLNSRLNILRPKAIMIGKRRVIPREIKGRNQAKSDFRAFVIDEFLSSAECDKLRWIHNSHVWSMSTYDPIICFDLQKTMDFYTSTVSRKRADSIIIPGTLCVNGTLPGIAERTIYINEFFKGESSFSLDLANRIETAFGLTETHGHSFTITSHPINPDSRILKNQKGCLDLAQSGGKQKTIASVFVFLSNSSRGGHITFKDAGITIEQRMGRAVAWTTQSAECAKKSLYDISPYQNGTLYTLQQWFYTNQFEGIGERVLEPEVPFRQPSQAYMHCDQVSCQWLNNWNHYSKKTQ